MRPDLKENPSILSKLSSKTNPLFKKKIEGETLLNKRIKKNQQFVSILNKTKKSKVNQRFKNILSTADLLKIDTKKLKTESKQNNF